MILAACFTLRGHDIHIDSFFQRNRRLVSSVGRAPVCWVGGRGFKLRPDQHSEESAAFVMTCKRLHFLVFSDKDKKP